MIAFLSFKSLFRSDRRLGVANKKRQYDLPLDAGEGSNFLILLIGLMTFLGVIALAGAFALGAMTERWSSGLEDKFTIEIPAEDSKGDLRTQTRIEALLKDVGESLKDEEKIQKYAALTEEEIHELISPWLGNTIILEDFPLPGLISVEMKGATPQDIETLQNKIQNIDVTITINTHKKWLSDIISFTNGLQLCAFVIITMISITTIIAVAAAVRSRVALYKADVELLHLMGASDRYISKQFQRHAMILALQGAILGTLAGIVVLTLIDAVSGDVSAALLPDFAFTAKHYFLLFCLPVIVALIATFTARITVLRVLSLMP